MSINTLIYALLCCFIRLPLCALHPESDIQITPEECLFVRCVVPERGVVCSNHSRVLRLSKLLENKQEFSCSWGPVVFIGDYEGQRIFVASAPVGTGSGLVFTELFAQGAKYVLRYGSDDVKAPPASDAYLVKIIDEADNLYGFNLQSGVDPQEWGQVVLASKNMIQALVAQAEENGILYEKRICHHLENYHGLRSPHRFEQSRQVRLEEQLASLKQNPKPASFDMETAVLFRVAKDFHAHAACVLQTFNKEAKKLGESSEQEIQQMRLAEETIFFPFVLKALLRMNELCYDT